MTSIWKTQQWPQDWKMSVFIPMPKKDSAKECSNYCTIALTSHTSQVMLKILQTRLQQYVNCELPDIQAGSWRSFLYSSSVYSCHLFLISSASLRSIPFLSLIEPIFAWNGPLVSLLFLKWSLVFPILLFSSISLHWSLRKTSCKYELNKGQKWYAPDRSRRY